GATGFEHADDHAVLAAHTPHDLAHRVEGAELTGDIAFYVLKQLKALGRVEGHRAALVIIRADIREHLAAIAVELIADAVIPLDRIQHPNRRLGLDDPVGQAANDQLVLLALFYRHAVLPVVLFAATFCSLLVARCR